MAALGFPVGAGVGSFLIEDLAGIVRSLPLLCHLKSVPWACWQLSKSLYFTFGTTWLHLRPRSLVLYYSTVQAGEENGFINVPVPIINNFYFYSQIIWKTHPLHMEIVNLSFGTLFLQLVKATIMPSSCSGAEWLLFAHFHICNHLIQLLQTVTVTC